MTRLELSDLAHKWITLWNTPTDWALFNSLHSDYFEDKSPAGRGSTKTDFTNGLKQLVRAFPDLKTNVQYVVIDEVIQQVAVRWFAVGTNKMKFLGIGPTNRKTSITGIEIIEFNEGQIIKRWGEWDISDHHE